jgi:hypothetical protein
LTPKTILGVLAAAALLALPASAMADITIPAGSTASISASLGACNSLSYGYQLDGGSRNQLGFFGGGCGRQFYPTTTLGPFSTSRQLRLWATDNNCGYFFDQNGPHASVGGGPNNYSVNIADGGGFCEHPPSLNVFGNNMSASVTISQPVVPLAITPNARPAANANGWYTSNVTQTWSCSGGTGGPTSATVSKTISTDGANQSVTGTCTDGAGHSVSDTRSGFNVDKTNPTITVASRPDAGSWSNGDVTVKWTCADDLSGATAAGDSATLSDEGADQSATGTCTDKAGNSASDTQKGINIDKTAPSIALVSRTPANANGWNNGDVKVVWSCSDALSGATADGDSATLSSEGAGQSATGKCTDKAGNSAGDTQNGINIDTTPPSVSYAGNKGSYTVADTVSITCSASDALSGVASSTCKDISGDASSFALGTNSYSASATDKADNTGSGATSFKVTVDAASLCTLTKRWVTNAGIASALCAKLDAAQASIARGDANSKDGQLGAYRNQLSAQAGKSVTADHAATLAKLSQAL